MLLLLNGELFSLFLLPNFLDIAAHSLDSITPHTVDTAVAISDGSIMSDADAEPAARRIPITVAGTSCMEVALITMSSAMLSLAFSEPSDIFSIALIPIGVAAEPMPSRLADRLSDIY